MVVDVIVNVVVDVVDAVVDAVVLGCIVHSSIIKAFESNPWSLRNFGDGRRLLLTKAMERKRMKKRGNNIFIRNLNTE